jgi:hypothetical protein
MIVKASSSMALSALYQEKDQTNKKTLFKEEKEKSLF